MSFPITAVEKTDSGRYEVVSTQRNGKSTCIADVPTVSLSLLVSHATKLIPTTGYHRKNIRAIPESIFALGSEAAHLREQCLTAYRMDIPAMPHLYATDKGRYAISTANLSYAHHASNPDQISEELIYQQDLDVTCFISKLSLASFLVNYSTGSFGSKTNHRHNTYIIGGKDHPNSLYIYTTANADPKPVADVIAEASPSVQRMLVSVAEYQAAYARLHLAMSKITITHL